MKNRKLNGKVAVVTGGSKGIGAGIAKQLAAEGAAVVVNYASSKADADKVVDEIAKGGGKAVAGPSQAQKARKIFMVPKFTGMVLTSVVAALAITITTQSFAQDRGTDATPAAAGKAGATQGTFMTSDAIPWKPVDPKHPGLQMFAVWGNPNEGASEILQKFPAGMDSGWHWHTAAYEGVVIQGKFTHTFKGAAPQTGGPGSVWSQPARQVHDDKCEEGGDCIVLVYFHGKLDFKPVDMKAQ